MENSVRRIYPKILSVITNPCLSHDEKAMLRIATLLNYFMNWGCSKISREVYLPWASHRIAFRCRYRERVS